MTDTPDPLPCGVRLGDLLEQVADGVAPVNPKHQSSCPYCQTALRRLRRGWADVTDLASEPVSVPSGLTAQIMRRVRALAVRATDYLLLGQPRGDTLISHAVVGRIVQRLARTVPDVTFASAQVKPRNPPQPDRLDLSIHLIGTLGPRLPRLADSVRLTVRRHTRRLTGAQVERIDITIDDVDVDDLNTGDSKHAADRDSDAG